MYFLEFYPLNYLQTGTFMLPSVYQGVAVRAHISHFGKVRNSYFDFFFFFAFFYITLKKHIFAEQKVGCLTCGCV